jgi:thiol:disulfide interchange protein DsbD
MLKLIFLIFALIQPLTLPAAALQQELLEPEKAFQFEARVVDPTAIEVRYRIADGYYLYRDKFKFEMQPADAAAGAPRIPPGKVKEDPYFGKVETYRGEVRIVLPVRAGETAVPLKLVATSQGCADMGVCYVPQEHRAELRLASLGPGSPSSVLSAAPAGNATSPLFGERAGGANSDEGRVVELFKGAPWVLVASFFGFGLLLAFTPCVLPMVPILSGIIIGSGRQVSRTHGFFLALAYVLGMAVTYALAGVAAGLSGSMLSAALQNAWVLGGFALVFVALALAMFGVYQLQLPGSLQTRLAEASNRQHGGRFAGVFAMGALSALIVGPCVAAPLAGALLYISQSRDVVLGGTALFAMALGMGVPLLVVGASAGALLPRTGPWMDAVKRFFGILLLATALYLVAPVLDIQVQMLGWAVLLIGTGVYWRALDPLPHGAGGAPVLIKGAGVVTLLIGIAFLVGALSGSRDLLRPLSGLQAGESRAAPATAFQKVSSLTELESAISASAGRPVMLDFYADWCVSCKEMERNTFTDANVRARLAGMTTLQADVTANNADHQALLKRFKLFGPPGIIFFDRQGAEIRDVRVIGYQPATAFAAVLDSVLR